MLRKNWFPVSVVAVPLLFLLGMVFFASPAHARSFYYSSYDVSIDVAEDSTMDVTESVTYVFDGTYSAVTRGIQLDDPSVRNACQRSGSLTCGGFDYIALQSVEGDGRELSSSEYTLGVEEYDDGTSYYIIDWEFAPDGRFFSRGEALEFVVKYRVYGGVEYVGDNAYFYWNTLPSDKGGRVESAQVDIHLPADVVANVSDLEVYGNFNYSYNFDGSSISLHTTNLAATSDFTVSYAMPRDAISGYADVSINGSPLGQDLYIDGLLVGQTNFQLEHFPSGQHQIRGEFAGYEPREISITVEPGEAQTVQLDLTPLPTTQFFLLLNTLSFIAGICLMPIAIFAAYTLWKRRGVDQEKVDTVYPQFDPPRGMHPYMVGALVDESVDNRDLVGTLIDLAYRGYIKIVELDRNKNYKLIKLKEDLSELTKTEEDVISALFGSKTEIETKERNNRFATRYPKIKSSIYKQLVNDGYFTTNPQTTRGTYAGCGVGILALGLVLAACLAFLVVGMLGQVGPLTLGLALAVFGIGVLVASPFMPAKTAHGSQVHNHVLGFKMYLETAEKYTLQDLTPEKFERFLAFAIVFGVEEKWAQKFKDIYNQQPDWYESSSTDAFNAYWLTRSMRGFSNNMTQSVFTPVSSGASGGGWSGSSGSFGGFSGGGGGGGFSGAR